MRPHLPALAILAAIATHTPVAVAQDDPLVFTALDCSQRGMTCRYWEPVAYDPGRQYPLIVYLHGAGESGTDAKHLSYFAGALHALFDQDTGYPLDDVFIVAPQCNCDLETQRWVNWPWENGAYSLADTPESEALLETGAMIRALQASYSIDPDRLYAMGVSMGGFGTWDLVARYPTVFAAGAPVAGGGAPDAAPGMRNLATWSSHNADDDAVPISGDRDMFRALALAGARPTYTEGVTGGHDDAGHVRSEAFRPWLLEQRRGVPGTSTPELRFEPEGGLVTPGTLLSLSTTREGASIRYTLDGSMPDASLGTEYTGPFPVEASAIIIAVASDEEQLVYHAAPFDVGDGGPALSEGGTGGGTWPTGGTRNIGGATAGVPGAAGNGGAAPPATVGAGAPGVGGLVQAENGGSSAPGGAPPTVDDSSEDDGCSCSTVTRGAPGGVLLLLLTALAVGAGRVRRRPTRVSRACA